MLSLAVTGLPQVRELLIRNFQQVMALCAQLLILHHVAEGTLHVLLSFVIGPFGLGKRYNL